MQAKGGHVGLARATEFFPKLPSGNQRVARSACPLLATLTQSSVSSLLGILTLMSCQWFVKLFPALDTMGE